MASFERKISRQQPEHRVFRFLNSHAQSDKSDLLESRHTVDSRPISPNSELATGAPAVSANGVGESGRNLIREVRRAEEEAPERIRLIEPEDVQVMIDKGWFEDWDRIKGLKGDVINEKTVPAVWTDETRRKFRDEVLMPFYFPPGGKEHVTAKDEKGNIIREEDVKRQSYVFEWKGELMAARSFMDQDPWASPADFAKFKMAHAQMFIVAPGKEGHGFGRGLAAHTHREIFGQGFTQIITWVNMEGTDYGVQEQFFKKMGYKEERKQKGLLDVLVAATGETITIRKYWLTPKKMNENLATDNNPWLVWERAKAKLERLEREELMKNSSRQLSFGE